MKAFFFYLNFASLLVIKICYSLILLMVVVVIGYFVLIAPEIEADSLLHLVGKPIVIIFVLSFLVHAAICFTFKCSNCGQLAFQFIGGGATKVLPVMPNSFINGKAQCKHCLGEIRINRNSNKPIK